MEFPETSLQIIHLPEPVLEFGNGQLCEHPKDGLFLYGPHDGKTKPRHISVGIIGTKKGLTYAVEWANRISQLVAVPPPKKGEKVDRLHLSDFPGLSEAFGIYVDVNELVLKEIDEKKLEESTRTLNPHEAVSKAVDIYIEQILKHDKNEEHDVHVWLFILPELVFERCRPDAKRTGLSLVKGDFGKKKKARSDLPLLGGVIDPGEEDIFDDVPDFHRQVKARLLKIGYTSQLLRETTLAPDDFKNSAGYPKRGLQEPATVAWNLGTGLYYKTQPKPPWRLVSARPGVCYVGLVFKVIPNHPQEYVCCAAQMFLSEGDGVVFRGANGPWKTGKNEYHLEPSEATRLISMVVETYKEKHGTPPKELFIHGRTKFRESEWQGFVNAAPKETLLVGVRIRETRGDVKLFRDGDYPVLRGTAMIIDERHAFLWTNGFLARLDTYIGPETPNPLSVTVTRSTAEFPPIENVLEDIMGLTKINYNACNYNDGLPVTVRFADKVGDILTMGSAKDAEKQPFKFYV